MNISDRDRIKQLLWELEKDERLIYDELGVRRSNWAKFTPSLGGCAVRLDICNIWRTGLIGTVDEGKWRETWERNSILKTKLLERFRSILSQLTSYFRGLLRTKAISRLWR